MTPAPTPPTPTSLRAEGIALAAVLALAATLRFLGIGWSLPSLFEEATPFRTAWEMWGFAPLRHFDLNPHWFTYPSLIFYLQMAGQALTFGLLRLLGGAHSLLDLRVRFFTDPTPYVLVARSITALFGAATVLPAWSIARRAGGPWAAALAAMVVALHPDLIAKSQVIEVDVPLAFFMALAVDRMLAARDSAGLGRWIVAGVVAGLATASKYPGLVLVAPLAVAAWWPRPEPGPVSAAARPAGRRATNAKTPRATGGGGAPLRFAAALAALGLTFLITSPFVVLDWATARQQMEQARDLMTKGHFGVAAGSAYATYAHDWFARLVGWPLGFASLAAILFFSQRRKPWA